MTPTLATIAKDLKRNQVATMFAMQGKNGEPNLIGLTRQGVNMNTQGTIDTSVFEGEMLKKLKIALKILLIISLFVVAVTPIALLIATSNMWWLFGCVGSSLAFWGILIIIIGLVIERLKD